MKKVEKQVRKRVKKTDTFKAHSYVRRPRRKLDTYSMTIPEASLSVRTLIDRTAKGLPINARLSKHIPLPADGLLPDDWETGTEEILDVTDAVEHSEKIRKELEYIAKKKEEAIEEQIGQTPSADAPQKDA